MPEKQLILFAWPNRVMRRGRKIKHQQTVESLRSDLETAKKELKKTKAVLKEKDRQLLSKEDEVQKLGGSKTSQVLIKNNVWSWLLLERKSG